MIGVGITLQPDSEFLDVLGDVLRAEVDYFEIAPETTWRERPDGTLVENGYFRKFLDLGAVADCPFVAHGVGLSVGTASPKDRRRRKRWLDRIALDQASFAYRWYTDHLGASSVDGLAMTLPLSVPMTPYAANVIRRALRRLQSVVFDVGIENSVLHFVAGAALDEPAFLSSATQGSGMHLVLDLHNVHTMAQNLGFEPRHYIDRLPLEQVIEIHVSGGSDSDPEWLPNGRGVRLDAHDSPVPDAVFRLLEDVLPRCSNLRGVTLERMEGTVQLDDAAIVRGELRSIRRLVSQRGAVA